MNFYDVLAAEKWDGGIPTINFFDLLFAQYMGGGEQWETYEGTLPATINANGDNMKQYQVYGAAGGVGDRTENLFDKNAKNPDNGFVNDKYLSEDGAENYSSSYYISEFMPITSGEPYALCNAAPLSMSIAICFYTAEKSYISGAIYDVYHFPRKKLVIAPANAAYARATVDKLSTNVSFIHFTTPTEVETYVYVPFGYEVDMRVGSWSPYATHTGTVIDVTTGGENSSPQYSTAYFNNFFPSTAIITVKADTAGGGRTLQYMPYDENQAPMLDYKAEVQFARDGRVVQQAVTIPSSATYYGVSYHNGDTQKKISTITPIYIGNEPLEKVGNYADYADYQKQKVVRAIKKYMLTGNENWEEITGAYASRTYFRLVFAPINYCVRHVCTCSHFEQASITTATTTVGFDVFDSASVNGEVLAIRPSDVQTTTLTDFKAWLAEQYAEGTPVTVWCALTTAEETDPPVPLPALPTCDGTTVIDYAGESVAPEKVYFEYKGGKQP